MSMPAHCFCLWAVARAYGIVSIYLSEECLMSSLSSCLTACLCPCCRCLLLTSGSAVDAAVSTALKPEQASAAAGTSAQQQNVAQFAQAALSSHSAHAPLAGSSTTIADAVDSPSAELRRMVRNPPIVCLTTTGN